jgi:hypothetical protein
MAMKSKLTMVAALAALSVCASPGVSSAYKYSTASMWFGDGGCLGSGDGGVENTCSTTQTVSFAMVTDTTGTGLGGDVYVYNPSASSVVSCEFVGTHCNSGATVNTGYHSVAASGNQDINFTTVDIPCAAYVVCQIPHDGWVWGIDVE